MHVDQIYSKQNDGGLSMLEFACAPLKMLDDSHLRVDKIQIKWKLMMLFKIVGGRSPWGLFTSQLIMVIKCGRNSLGTTKI